MKASLKGEKWILPLLPWSPRDFERDRIITYINIYLGACGWPRVEMYMEVFNDYRTTLEKEITTNEI